MWLKSKSKVHSSLLINMISCVNFINWLGVNIYSVLSYQLGWSDAGVIYLKLAKLLLELKSKPVWYKKMFTGLFCMPLTLNNLKKVLFLCIAIYIINLSLCAHWRLATELPCLCVTLETTSFSSGLFVSYCLILFVCTTTYRSI